MNSQFCKLGSYVYTHGVRALDRQTLISFWMAIARVPFGKSLQKATAIRDPCTDTFTASLGHRFCPSCLAEYFVEAYHRQQRRRLHGGSYVTTIARSLGILPESDPLLSPTIPSTTLGWASVSSMRLTHMFNGIRVRFQT
ncbi:hypothetical protein Hanom_Chr09g00825121 [Helianthus anomalus]